MALKHIIQGCGPDGAMSAERAPRPWRVRRDVASRGLEQKLASIHGRRASIDDLRFRVKSGVARFAGCELRRGRP